MDKKLVDSEVTSSSKMGHYRFCSDGNPTLSILWSYSHGQLKTYKQKQNWTNNSSKPEIFPALLWIFSFFPSTNPTKNHHQPIAPEWLWIHVPLQMSVETYLLRLGRNRKFCFLDEICSIDKFSVVGGFNQKSTKIYLRNQKAENFFWVCYTHSIFELEFQQQQPNKKHGFLSTFIFSMWYCEVIGWFCQWKGAYQLASPMSMEPLLGHLQDTRCTSHHGYRRSSHL